MQQFFQHNTLYIDGQWLAPTGSGVIEVIGANTGEPIGQVPEGTNADIDLAVASARRAMEGAWGHSTPADRSALLSRFADALEKRIEPLSRLVSMQNGMPLAIAEPFEGGYSVGMLRYYAALAGSLQIEERRASPLGFDTLVRKEPMGVVAAIVPWNFPVAETMMKLAPALSAGCAVVLKPSPGTVLDGYVVAEAAQEAGLPAGVINWVPGGREVGAYLVQHPAVDKVAFTGSTAAGRQIGAVCGRLLRPATLELGGKSAAIILDDASVEAVAAGMVFAGFANNGQTCALSTRVLVPESRYDEFVDALAAMASSLKVGDSLDKTTQVGPMASQEHRSRVERYIGIGKGEGRLVAGGGRPKGLQRGWFIEPTVFADVSNHATIAREEIFGPVLAIIKVRDEDEAVRVANDSEYGLAGTVWSADSQRAQVVARRVRTGTIGVNGYAIDLNAPFGGVKGSGLGREMGPESISAYQQFKSIYLPVG